MRSPKAFFKINYKKAVQVLRQEFETVITYVIMQKVNLTYDMALFVLTMKKLKKVEFSQQMYFTQVPYVLKLQTEIAIPRYQYFFKNFTFLKCF